MDAVSCRRTSRSAVVFCVLQRLPDLLRKAPMLVVQADPKLTSRGMKSTKPIQPMSPRTVQCAPITFEIAVM